MGFAMPICRSFPERELLFTLRAARKTTGRATTRPARSIPTASYQFI
jgi:hypothetical protein